MMSYSNSCHKKLTSNLHFQAWLHPTHLQSFSEECSPSVLMPECESDKICDTQSGQMPYQEWTHQKMPVSYLHAVSELFRLTLISLRMAAEQYCLKWTNYQRNVTSSFKTLLENEEFVDVSIFCPSPIECLGQSHFQLLIVFPGDHFCRG